MNKCLITKLNGFVNNPELLRLGEMRMKTLKVSNLTEHAQGFGISVNKTVTLVIVSDGYFTDKTLTENKGKNATLNVGFNDIWVNGKSDVEIAILDKYSLTTISSYGVNWNILKFSISDLKYSTALTSLILLNTQVSGDIANLKGLTALTSLGLSNTQVSGDIANLKGLTALTSLGLSNTQVSGDIANLKGLTALTSLGLSNTQVSGDIANLKGLTALTSLDLSNTQVPLTGDIGQLSSLSNCLDIKLKNSKLTGDLAMLPSKCRFVSFQYDKGSVFTWSTRPSSAKIIAIEGKANLTNIDKMLQDQAQCQVGFSPNNETWYKTISVAGNRTSSSDNAVETLQRKGYTISIAKA
ncbi:MAG: hypothetical protein V8T35_07580 [Prevotella sp.]